MMAFVPVSDNITKRYSRGCQLLATGPVLSTVLNTISTWQNRYILNQDTRVVSTQYPNSSFDAKEEFL